MLNRTCHVIHSLETDVRTKTARSWISLDITVMQRITDEFELKERHPQVWHVTCVLSRWRLRQRSTRKRKQLHSCKISTTSRPSPHRSRISHETILQVHRGRYIKSWLSDLGLAKSISTCISRQMMVQLGLKYYASCVFTFKSSSTCHGANIVSVQSCLSYWWHKWCFGSGLHRVWTIWMTELTYDQIWWNSPPKSCADQLHLRSTASANVWYTEVNSCDGCKLTWTATWSSSTTHLKSHSFMRVAKLLPCQLTNYIRPAGGS